MKVRGENFFKKNYGRDVGWGSETPKSTSYIPCRDAFATRKSGTEAQRRAPSSAYPGTLACVGCLGPLTRDNLPLDSGISSMLLQSLSPTTLRCLAALAPSPARVIMVCIIIIKCSYLA